MNSIVTFNDTNDTDDANSSTYEINKVKKNIIKLLELNKDVITPFFMPIMDNKTGKILKYEALARIKYCDNYMLPSSFLNIIENTPLESELTLIIVEKTILKLLSNPDIEVSINLSENNLKNSSLIKQIVNLLKVNNVDISRLHIELLESIDFSDDNIIQKITILKERGFKLVLDDVGKLNFNNTVFFMKHNLVDYVKLDKDIVLRLNNKKKSSANIAAMFIKNVVEEANQKGQKVIAEYVRNKNIHSMLKELNVHFSQGYLIGAPSAKLLSNKKIESIEKKFEKSC